MNKSDARRRLLGGGLLTLVSGLAAFLLPHRLSTDLFDLLPRGEPAVDNVRKVAEIFGGSDQELITVSWGAQPGDPAGELDGKDDEEQRALAGALVDELAARLRAQPEIAAVLGDLHNSAALMEGMGRVYLDLLPPVKRTAFQQRVSPEGMRAALRGGKELLGTPAGAMAGDYFRQDPLGLQALVLEGQSPPGRTRPDLINGLLLSPDGFGALLLVRGARPLTDLAEAKKTGAAIDAVITAALTAVAITPEDGFRVARAGGYSIAARDEAMIRHDAANGASVTLLLVFLLLVWVTRSGRAPLLLLVPFAAATFWLLALIFLSPVKIGASAAGCTGILIGLGSDLALVLYARTLAKLQAGLPPEEAVRTAAREGRLALWLCTLTTAATFGALCLTTFPVLRQMGMIVAFGMLLSALATQWLLPALLLVFMPAAGFKPMRNLTAGWLDRLQGGGLRVVLWMVSLAAAAGFILLAGRRANFDLAEVHRKSNPEVGTFEAQLDRFGLPREAQVVMLAASSEDDLRGQCAGLWRSGLAPRSSGLCRWLRAGDQPPDSIVVQISAPPVDGAALARQFEAELRAEGFMPEAFSAQLAFLQEMGHPGASLLDSRILGEFIRPAAAPDPSASGAARFYAQVILPADSVIPAGALPASARIASIPAMNAALLKLGRRDLSRAYWAGILVVMALVAFGLRSFKYSVWVMALYPMALGALLLPLLLGWMEIDMLALAGVLVLCGIVTDYGIQWLAARPQDGRPEDPALRHAVNNALALDALTTLIAFLSLLTASYVGLKNLGWVAGLGSLAGCLFALLGLGNRKRP